MQENEFEKQVKASMDELSFTPSAPVWEAIKKQLEKKKRRLLPFIFLLAAVITVGGYYVYVNVLINTKKPADTITVNNKKLNHNLLTANENEKIKFNQPGSASSQNTQVIIKENHDYDSSKSIIANLKNFYQHQQSRFITMQNQKTGFTGIDETIQSMQTVTRNDYSLTSIDTLSYKMSAAIDTDLLGLKQSADSIKENIVIQSQGNNDSIIKTSFIKNNNNKFSDTSVSASNKNQKPNKNKSAKWNWGITAMIGRSNVVNNFKFSNFQSEKANNVDILPRDTTALATYKNKPYWPAKAYDFGITVQRKILKNSYINFGLQYLHLSTKSYTAISLNNSLIPVAASSYSLTTPAIYYRPGTKKTYTNKCNFIALPASFQSSLLHKNRFGILYDAGASVMQLINKNSLLYNSDNKTYFKDSSNLLRRTQFQLSAGLDFQLQIKHAGSILIGPGIKYSLSGFLKNNDYDKLHYMHFDLRAAWLFNKN